MKMQYMLSDQSDADAFNKDLSEAQQNGKSKDIKNILDRCYYRCTDKESKSTEAKCITGKITVYKDGAVAVGGDVWFFNCRISKIPVKFKEVNGRFNVSNSDIESFENAPGPKTVAGRVFCRGCSKLVSLEGFNYDLDQCEYDERIKALIVRTATGHLRNPQKQKLDGDIKNIKTILGKN